ncbi:hypothetical protein EJ04DRAFT_95585 [Polyplosphaeria fusca]|uniref:Myb-like domain-containing protein n=1 Tax=Polyplosphaeria fusca TaxID=682080 RepID=A0A9P4R209_9PLEO|nr:hypothetical protein EJ04DRAFT_95585 [Polyplosphaeria fusca]
MSDPSPSSSGIYGYGPPQHSSTRKRSRAEDQLQQLGVPQLDHPPDPYGQPSGSVSVAHHTPQGYTLHPFPQPTAPPTDQPRHHHHTLPGPRPAKRQHMDEPQSPLQSQHGPPSMVGQEGMPPPAPRPRGPKLKFTPEDDQLLVDLKEKKNLTWKQIADFFPGRSSGTLQVRYCTKLKAKTTVWTDEMVQKLRNAMQEYENDRWRIISSKVGSGFSPAACREKASDIEAIEAEEEEHSSYTQAQLGQSSNDPGSAYQ